MRNAMNRKSPIKRSDTGVRRATGRGRDEWFTVLDASGARGRPYREIAKWLTDKHGISNWWAQKLIVEYQQARGLRAPGVRRDGTFTVTASKTLSVPGKRAFEAFVNARLRKRWLPSAVMHKRTSQPGRSVRFDWKDGATRVNVTITTSKGKSQAAVEHQRLPDSETAGRIKAFWRDRLIALKTLLES